MVPNFAVNCEPGALPGGGQEAWASKSYGPESTTRENLTMVHANNKGADQPAHPCSLISAFVIRYLKDNVIKYLLLALDSLLN